jgi:hypothetical protein
VAVLLAGILVAVDEPEPAAEELTTSDPVAPQAGGQEVRPPRRPRASDESPTPARVAREAASQVHPEQPTSVALPSRTLVPVTTSATSASGALVLPEDVNRAGWWDGGSKLGDPFGAIVVAAHVDSFTQGLGAFAELLAVEPGDRLRVTTAGLTQEFRVIRADLVPKASLSGDSPLFSPYGEPRLVLITCGGAYDADAGGYQDNRVVIARPSGPLEEVPSGPAAAELR